MTTCLFKQLEIDTPDPAAKNNFNLTGKRNDQMKVEQWSQQEIEDCCTNINLLYSKANEMRNQAIREFFAHINSVITSQMKGCLYRITHFGHKPQMR